MFRSRTRPFNACTGNGKHKNHEIKNLFKESLLRPDCRVNPVVGDGDKPEDKRKPKKFRVIPLHKTINVVSSAEIHARKERQRIKREVLYTPKELPPLPVVKQETRTAPKKYELVKGLNAIKEIKVEKKVPHWEVFPSIVKHEVRSSEEDLSDTETEELEKLILPLYPFQCNLPPLKKTEVDHGTSSKTTEDAATSNEKNEGESSATKCDKTEIKEETEKVKEQEEEEKKVVSTEIKDEPHETCEKEEKKNKSKKTPKKNATKGKTKKKEKLPSSNEEITKVESADRVLTRTAKSKLLKNVNVKEEKEAQKPEAIQNTGRITRSKAKNQTETKTVEPKIDKKKKEKKKKEKATTAKGKVPASKGKAPAVKGKVAVDNGVARGRSVKKKIKINFHDKKSLKHFKDFSLTIETD